MRQATVRIGIFLFSPLLLFLHILFMRLKDRDKHCCQTVRKQGVKILNNYYNPYYPAGSYDNRMSKQDNCKCEVAKTSFPEDYALAMAYVPFQSFKETYDAEKALCQGTLFPCLDKPFVGC